MLSYFVVVTAADLSEPSSLTALLLSFLVVLVASSISDFAFLLSLSSEVNASAVVGPWTSHIGSEVNAIDIVQSTDYSVYSGGVLREANDSQTSRSTTFALLYWMPQALVDVALGSGITGRSSRDRFIWPAAVSLSYSSGCETPEEKEFGSSGYSSRTRLETGVTGHGTSLFLARLVDRSTIRRGLWRRCLPRRLEERSRPF